MASQHLAVRAFWWRPLTGSRRQRALDFYHLWTRNGNRKILPPWRLRNFGDELVPLIWERAVPDRGITHADLGRAELALVGSVLQRFKPGRVGNPMVLGPGLTAEPPVGDLEAIREALADCDIRGVRGPLTARALGLDPKLARGDAALALCGSSLLERSSPTGRGVVVAHFGVGRSAGLIRALALHAARLDADVVFSWEPPNEVARKVANASWAMSTSLHGVIVADIAGVPALPVTLADKQVNDFRFSDYGECVGRRTFKQVPLSKVSISEAAELSNADFVDPRRISDMGESILLELRSWAKS